MSPCSSSGMNTGRRTPMAISTASSV